LRRCSETMKIHVTSVAALVENPTSIAAAARA
jgi:hypothetical protein